jgi:hypothetical protein
MMPHRYRVSIVDPREIRKAVHLMSMAPHENMDASSKGPDEIMNSHIASATVLVQLSCKGVEGFEYSFLIIDGWNYSIVWARKCSN